MLAMRVHEYGGPEKIRVEDIPRPEPGPGEIRVHVEAAGVNFVDTYERSGLYGEKLPFTLGREVAGIVAALGPGVDGFRIGDRVATARATGGYAEEAIVRSQQLVHVPKEISARTAAALLLQGLTAHYLASDTFPLKPGDAALVHAAAGGVGLLLVQIAAHRGARVLAVTGSEEKAALAREAGADEAVVYGQGDFVAAARRFTGDRGVDVVYDGVGKDTFEGSLDCLRPRGMLVTYGNASGPVPPFSPLVLSRKGSLFLTRPTLGDYTQTAAELRARATELFEWVMGDTLQVRVGATFPLAGAANAHRALESRATTGKVLLLPDL
jgi:NADPH2:quinone reductase